MQRRAKHGAAKESKAVSLLIGVYRWVFPSSAGHSNVRQSRAMKRSGKQSGKGFTAFIGGFSRQVQSNAKHGVAEQCTAKRCNAAHWKAKR